MVGSNPAKRITFYSTPGLRPPPRNLSSRLSFGLIAIEISDRNECHRDSLICCTVDILIIPVLGR